MSTEILGAEVSNSTSCIHRCSQNVDFALLVFEGFVTINAATPIEIRTGERLANNDRDWLPREVSTIFVLSISATSHSGR